VFLLSCMVLASVAVEEHEVSCLGVLAELYGSCVSGC